MPRFIPSSQLKQLRDAARGGDARAKSILMAQIDPTSDFDNMFKDYFAPVPETPVEAVSEEEIKVDPNDGDAMLKKFLSDNGVSEGDDDYDDTVEMFYHEFPKHDHRGEHEEECDHVVEKLEEPENIMPNEVCECRSLATQLRKLVADENEAIRGYDEAIMVVTNDPEMANDEKTVMITTLQSIKNDELEHISILMDKLKKYEKKENKELEPEMDEVPEAVI